MTNFADHFLVFLHSRARSATVIIVLDVFDLSARKPLFGDGRRDRQADMAALYESSDVLRLLASSAPSRAPIHQRATIVGPVRRRHR